MLWQATLVRLIHVALVATIIATTTTPAATALIHRHAEAMRQCWGWMKPRCPWRVALVAAAL